MRLISRLFRCGRLLGLYAPALICVFFIGLDGTSRWRSLVLTKYVTIQDFPVTQTNIVDVSNGRLAIKAKKRGHFAFTAPIDLHEWRSYIKPTSEISGWRQRCFANETRFQYQWVDLISVYFAGFEVFWRVQPGLVVMPAAADPPDLYEVLVIVPFYMLWVPLLPWVLWWSVRTIRNRRNTSRRGFEVEAVDR